LSELAVTGPSRTGLTVSLLGTLFLLVLLATALIPWSALTSSVTAAADPGLDFTDAEVARARGLRDPLRVLSVLGAALSLVIALVLGLTPVGAAIVEGVSFGRGPVLQTLVGVPALLLIGSALTLPLVVRAEQQLRESGLSTRTWGGFASDQLKAFGLQAVMVTAALGGLFWLVRVAPRWWPFVAAAAAVVLVLVLSALFPLVVEPLFNKFEPLPAGDQRDRLLAVADEAGVRVNDVLVADASRRTSGLNAYVSGIGPTRRIVVYDNLLQVAPPEQVESVVAHELGHAARRDVLVGSALGALGAAAVVLVVGLVLTSGGWVARAGAAGPGDPRVAGLILAVVAVATAIAAPASAAISRQVEARADEFALETTRDPAAFVSMQRTLALSNLADPDPPRWAVWWRGTHPTTGERMALARQWAASNGVKVPAPAVAGDVGDAGLADEASG
jgi:STE24 endopeptidase